MKMYLKLTQKQRKGQSATIKYSARKIVYIYYHQEAPAVGEINECGDKIIKKKGSVVWAKRRKYKGQKTMNVDDKIRNNKNLMISLLVVDLKKNIRQNDVVIDSVSSMKYHTVANGQKDFQKIKYEAVTMKSKLLEGVNQIKDVNNGFCVPEAFYNQLVGQKDWMALKKPKVFAQFEEVTCGKLNEGVNVEQTEEWQHRFVRYTGLQKILGLLLIVFIRQVACV